MGVAADLPFQPSEPPLEGEERFLLHGIPWGVYVALREALDESSSKVRLTYCEGDLELMVTGRAHERSKSLFASLFEAWCLDNDVEIFPLSAMTLKKKKRKRGLEADESYAIGTDKASPDVAIEVVFSSWRIDKLDVYRGLRVPEVWVYREGRIAVYRLGNDGYEHVARSALVPGLDLDHLATFIRPDESLNRVVAAYRASLRNA
jgi:Uma2 family endonuclease